MKHHKILVINYEYPPLGAGGGHACEEILKILVRYGYDVTLMTTRFRHLPKQEIRDGIKIIRIPTWRRQQDQSNIFEMLIFLLSSLIFVLPLFFRERPQVCLSFFSIPCGPAALLLKILFKVPYIIALRGGDVPGFWPAQLGRYHFFSNLLNRFLWKKASALTVNSQGLEKLAYSFLSSRTYHVIPNGIAPKFFQQRIKKNNEKILKVLTACRLSQHKNVDRLIDAIEVIHHHHGNLVHLYIAGDGPEKQSLEKRAQDKKILNESVFFLGWCEHSQLIDLYQEMDVFALASDFEGMPNSILQAMASSLAIVATQAQGTEELVRQGVNGYLISKDKLESFPKVFLNLQKNRELLFLLQNESFMMARKYTWDFVAQQYHQLLQAL